MEKVGIAVIIISGILLAITVYSANPFRISNVGTVSHLSAFFDANCTQSCTQISWGNLLFPSSQNKTIYLWNAGATNMTLNMTVSDWNPVNASNYMTATWDREGTTLYPKVPLATVITLAVATNINETTISDFSFYIQING